MGRISASLSGFELRILNRLQASGAAAAVNSLRLATGLKVNFPKDDPSAFVAISGLESNLSTVTATLQNVTAASSIVSQAQLNLDQVRTQLNTIRTKLLEDEDGSLTADERLANQAAIDTAISGINDLAAADIDGRRVLDGSADFVITGANNSQVRRIQVFARGPDTAPTITGSVDVAAEQATLTHTEVGGTFGADDSFTLTGKRGSSVITITGGDTVAQVRTKINNVSHQTGITAGGSGDDIVLTSVDFGTGASVTVSDVAGTFTAGTDAGVDAEATINGQSITGDGNRLSVGDNGFRFTLEIQSGFSGALDAITVSGDALSFALTTDPSRISRLAVAGVQAARLGGLSGTLDTLATGGSLAGLASNTSAAIRVVDEALDQLTVIEGAVDGFADAAITASDDLLTAVQTDLQDSIDTLNESDDDEQAVLLAKNQQLAANAISSLAVLADQRSSIVALIQQIAGLS